MRYINKLVKYDRVSKLAVWEELDTLTNKSLWFVDDQALEDTLGPFPTLQAAKEAMEEQSFKTC